MLLFVIDRSVTTLALLASEAALLPGTGSVTPVGAAIVAVFVSGPVVPPGTVPVTVKEAVAPTGRVTRASMSPLPLAVPQAPPAAPVQLHVKPLSAAGSASCTRAPVTSLGPTLVAVIV